MSFNQHSPLSDLHQSRYDWSIRVRAQSIWEGRSRDKKEFRGFNIVFIDDSNIRVHAFIAANISNNYKDSLEEGAVYKVHNFSVKTYNGDETYRPVRNSKHIYFNNDTKLIKDNSAGLRIHPHSFDFFALEDVEKLKKDNRFLIDVIGVIDVPPTKVVYQKDNVESFNVKCTITDGRYYLNVTLFGALGESLLAAMSNIVDEPVIMIIGSAKINEWKDQVSLTNYPATRIYLNSSHQSVRSIRKSLGDGSFYRTDLNNDEDADITIVSVRDLLSLKEEYINKKIKCKLTVKKVDQMVKWFTEYCIPCDVDLEFTGNKFKCPTCGKMKPYPDRRYQLITLCSDNTGTIPVMWSDDEVTRLTGKTVYDVLADDVEVADSGVLPSILKKFEKLSYTFTLFVKKENVLEGSNVYMAERVEVNNDKADVVVQPSVLPTIVEQKHVETSATHSPVKNSATTLKPTEVSNESHIHQESHFHDKSPPTAKSTTKTKARRSSETIEYDQQSPLPLGKRKSIKNEKYKN